MKKENSYTLGGVGFGMASVSEMVKSGKPFDLCYTLEENEWNGRKRIEMLVKDVQLETSEKNQPLGLVSEQNKGL